jgi:signal peptidase I
MTPATPASPEPPAWRLLLFGRRPARTLLRAVVWAAVAFLFFGRVLLPVRVNGESMEPTVHNGSLRFAFLLRYAVSDPRPGDLVVIRMAGKKVMYLKRILAVGGERVAFEGGTLRVNGLPRPEPYLRGASDWSMLEVVVPENEVFVAGDNRGVPMEAHVLGLVKRNRIAGGIVF